MARCGQPLVANLRTELWQVPVPRLAADLAALLP
jgi:hypothetical protein